MSQKRQGAFYILDEYYEDYVEDHREVAKGIEEEEFTRIRTIEGNKFSTPFQDIWTNPEQTHYVYYVHDPIVNTNYIRVRRTSDKSIEKPKSIRKLGGWFSSKEYTEISVEAIEALENSDEEEQVQAIFNFAIGFYVYDPRYPGQFEEYLESPSVKVRLATIRAIGFQLWNECAPLLENLISSDSNPAVKAYATETLRQIQQPDFDPDNLYENPSNYPHSFERITEKGLMILPQIKDDLQVWMEEKGYQLVDALVLYQYLVEVYGEFKPTDEPVDRHETADSSTNTEDNSEPTTETIEPNPPELIQSQQLQQQIAQDKKQLKRLRSQLKTIEERIENARRTNIFGRPESGANEREKERLVREIEDTKARIKQNESLLKAEEEQIESN